MCVWDEHKRRINVAKHGVDFADACRIFEGPVVEAPDLRRDYGETRIGAYGSASGRVLFVIYVRRDGQRRIISARKAGRSEAENYRAAVAR